MQTMRDRKIRKLEVMCSRFGKLYDDGDDKEDYEGYLPRMRMSLRK
jgi:hypothetical protein